MGLLTHNFQETFRGILYLLRCSILKSPISFSLKPLQIFPTRTLVEPYTKISLIQLRFTGLLAFPDSHALPQVAVFWIRLCCSHSFLLLQRFSGYFGCDNLSTISFLSPLGFAFSVTFENAVLYPQVSLLRSEPSLTSIFLSSQVDCDHTLRYQIFVFIL